VLVEWQMLVSARNGGQINLGRWVSAAGAHPAAHGRRLPAGRVRSWC